MTLKVINLSYSFGTLRALRDVSVSAHTGRLTAVLGPNASGKSTLLRCLAGVLRPTSGNVQLGDHSVCDLPPRDLAQQLAYVPQRSSVSAAFTVREIVELGRYVLPRSSIRVNAALAEMELTSHADRPFATLSVGQQQRVSLARALAQAPREGCLVLDEPTSAMDLRFQRLTMERLRTLTAEGASVVLAIHDISLAAAIADDIWILNEGELIAAGSAEDVMQVSLLEGVFNAPFEWVNTADGQRRLIPDLPRTTAAT